LKRLRLVGPGQRHDLVGPPGDILLYETAGLSGRDLRARRKSRERGVALGKCMGTHDEIDTFGEGSLKVGSCFLVLRKSRDQSRDQDGGVQKDFHGRRRWGGMGQR
jgi:hypothetical protein